MAGNINIFPTEIEGGEMTFGTESYFGLRFTDARDGQTVTVCLTREALRSLIPQLDFLRGAIDGGGAQH